MQECIQVRYSTCDAHDGTSHLWGYGTLTLVIPKRVSVPYPNLDSTSSAFGSSLQHGSERIFRYPGTHAHEAHITYMVRTVD